MATPVSKLSREALERELHSYLGPHGRGEVYELNIKIHQPIRIPPQVRQYASEDTINMIVEGEMRARLRNFAEDLVHATPWLRGWAQAGRQGGWLLLVPKVHVLGPDDEVKSLKAARKRLRGLRAIKREIEKGILSLVEAFESHAFWRVALPGYRGGGPKAWDPREL